MSTANTIIAGAFVATIVSALTIQSVDAQERSYAGATALPFGVVSGSAGRPTTSPAGFAVNDYDARYRGTRNIHKPLARSPR